MMMMMMVMMMSEYSPGNADVRGVRENSITCKSY